MPELFDWQAADVEALVRGDGIGVNTSHTGAGKSAVALSSAKELGADSVLVVSPKNTADSWRESVEMWWPEQDYRVIDASKAGNRAYLDLALGTPGVYQIGIERFRNQSWSSIFPDISIADEVHRLASLTSDVGRKALHSLSSGSKQALSATIVRNKIENIYGPAKWEYPTMGPWQPTEEYFDTHPGVNPDAWSKITPKKKIKDLDARYKWQFLELHYNVKKDFFAGWTVESEMIPGWVISRFPVHIEHRKRENCCEYHPEGFATWPEPQEHRIEIPMTPTQRKIYRQLDEQDLAWMGENALAPKIPLESRIRKLQIALGEGELVTDGEGKQKIVFLPEGKSPKADWIQDALTEGDLFGENVVVFTHSKGWSNALAQRLNKAGIPSLAWNSDTDPDDKTAARVQWVEGGLQVIVGVISAIGTGTDWMQRNCYNMVWASRSDDSTDNLQASGRLDRIGQQRGVMEWILQSEDTMEAGVESKQMVKQMQINESTRKRAEASGVDLQDF